MLPTSPPAKKIAGSITVPFENLPIWTEDGEARRYGIATYAYDGLGGYWPIALMVEARTYGAMPRSIPYGAGRWREIFRRLEQYQRDDIQARIAEDLEKRGMHMALFSEHLPPPAAQRIAPPHVTAEDRRTSLLIGAAGLCFEGAALAAFLAFVAAACLVSETAGPHHAAPIVATLESGDGR